MPTTYRLLLRVIACVVLVAFATETCAHAAPGVAGAYGFRSEGQGEKKLGSKDLVLPKDPIRLQIPFEHVTVKESHQGPSGKLIIHLQDPHSNLSGQKHLAGALGFFLKRYPIPLVLVEGSSTDVTLDWFKKIPSSKNLRIAAKQLLTKGILSGEEYLNLTSNHSMKLLGVESRPLYDEGLKAYALVRKERKEALRYLAKIRKALEQVKTRIYPKTLLSIEALRKENDEGAAYHGELLELAKEEGVSLADYPASRRFLELKGREDEIHFDRAAREQQALSERLMQSDLREETKELMRSFAGKKASPAQSHSFVRRLLRLADQARIGTSGLPELAKYISYLEEFDRLDLTAFLDEIEALERSVYEQMLTTEDARKIRAIDRYMRLLEKSYRIHMTSREFRQFETNESDFPTSSWIAFLNQKLTDHGLYESLIPELPFLDEPLADLKRFYTIVKERDEHFVENTQKYLQSENQNTAFLITGGYHTENLTRLMRDKGYSYIVLCPSVDSETDYDRYEKILLASLRQKQKPRIKLARHNRPADWVRKVGFSSPGGLDALRLAGGRLPEKIPGLTKTETRAVYAAHAVIARAAEGSPKQSRSDVIARPPKTSSSLRGREAAEAISPFEEATPPVIASASQTREAISLSTAASRLGATASPSQLEVGSWKLEEEQKEAPSSSFKQPRPRQSGGDGKVGARMSKEDVSLSPFTIHNPLSVSTPAASRLAGSWFKTYGRKWDWLPWRTQKDDTFTGFIIARIRERAMEEGYDFDRLYNSLQQDKLLEAIDHLMINVACHEMGLPVNKRDELAEPIPELTMRIDRVQDPSEGLCVMIWGPGQNKLPDLLLGKDPYEFKWFDYSQTPWGRTAPKEARSESTTGYGNGVSLMFEAFLSATIYADHQMGRMPYISVGWKKDLPAPSNRGPEPGGHVIGIHIPLIKTRSGARLGAASQPSERKEGRGERGEANVIASASQTREAISLSTAASRLADQSADSPQRQIPIPQSDDEALKLEVEISSAWYDLDQVLDFIERMTPLFADMRLPVSFDVLEKLVLATTRHLIDIKFFHSEREAEIIAKGEAFVEGIHAFSQRTHMLRRYQKVSNNLRDLLIACWCFYYPTPALGLGLKSSLSLTEDELTFFTEHPWILEMLEFVTECGQDVLAWDDDDLIRIPEPFVGYLAVLYTILVDNIMERSRPQKEEQTGDEEVESEDAIREPDDLLVASLKGAVMDAAKAIVGTDLSDGGQTEEFGARLSTGDEGRGERGEERQAGRAYFTMKPVFSRMMSFLSMSAGVVSLMSFDSAAIKSATTGGWIRNTTMPADLAGGKRSGSRKSLSWVTRMRDSFLESARSFPLWRPLGAKRASWPRDARNRAASIRTFSSSMNRNGLSEADIIPVLDELRRVMKSSFDVFLGQARITLDDLFRFFPGFEKLQHKVHHDPGALEARLSVADIGIYGNQFIHAVHRLWILVYRFLFPSQDPTRFGPVSSPLGGSAAAPGARLGQAPAAETKIPDTGRLARRVFSDGDPVSLAQYVSDLILDTPKLLESIHQAWKQNGNIGIDSDIRLELSGRWPIRIHMPDGWAQDGNGYITSDGLFTGNYRLTLPDDGLALAPKEFFRLPLHGPNGLEKSFSVGDLFGRYGLEDSHLPLERTIDVLYDPETNDLVLIAGSYRDKRITRQIVRYADDGKVSSASVEPYWFLHKADAELAGLKLLFSLHTHPYSGRLSAEDIKYISTHRVPHVIVGPEGTMMVYAVLYPGIPYGMTVEEIIKRKSADYEGFIKKYFWSLDIGSLPARVPDAAGARLAGDTDRTGDKAEDPSARDPLEGLMKLFKPTRRSVIQVMGQAIGQFLIPAPLRRAASIWKKAKSAEKLILDQVLIQEGAAYDVAWEAKDEVYDDVDQELSRQRIESGHQPSYKMMARFGDEEWDKFYPDMNDFLLDQISDESKAALRSPANRHILRQARRAQKEAFHRIRSGDTEWRRYAEEHREFAETMARHMGGERGREDASRWLQARYVSVNALSALGPLLRGIAMRESMRWTRWYEMGQNLPVEEAEKWDDLFREEMRSGKKISRREAHRRIKEMQQGALRGIHHRQEAARQRIEELERQRPAIEELWRQRLAIEESFLGGVIDDATQMARIDEEIRNYHERIRHYESVVERTQKELKTLERRYGARLAEEEDSKDLLRSLGIESGGEELVLLARKYLPRIGVGGVAELFTGGGKHLTEKSLGAVGEFVRQIEARMKAEKPARKIFKLTAEEEGWLPANHKEWLAGQRNMPETALRVHKELLSEPSHFVAEADGGEAEPVSLPDFGHEAVYLVPYYEGNTREFGYYVYPASAEGLDDGPGWAEDRDAVSIQRDASLVPFRMLVLRENGGMNLRVGEREPVSSSPQKATGRQIRKTDRLRGLFFERLGAILRFRLNGDSIVYQAGVAQNRLFATQKKGSTYLSPDIIEGAFPEEPVAADAGPGKARLVDFKLGKMPENIRTTILEYQFFKRQYPAHFDPEAPILVVVLQSESEIESVVQRLDMPAGFERGRDYEVISVDRYLQEARRLGVLSAAQSSALEFVEENIRLLRNESQSDDELVSLRHEAEADHMQEIPKGPDGDLFVCDNQGWVKPNNLGRILRLKIRDGRVTGVKVVAHSMSHPNGIRVRDGQLYVTQSMLVKEGDEPLISGVYRFKIDDEGIKVNNRLDDANLLVTFKTLCPTCQYGMDGLVFDSQGNLFVGNFGDAAIHKVTFDDQGNVKSSDVFAKDPCMKSTDGICIDEQDNIYVADFSGNAVCVVTAAGKVSVLAKSPDCDGSQGGLDQPGEPIVRGKELVVTNFDLVTGPDKVNTGHDRPYTMSVIELDE